MLGSLKRLCLQEEMYRNTLWGETRSCFPLYWMLRWNADPRAPPVAPDCRWSVPGSVLCRILALRRKELSSGIHLWISAYSVNSLWIHSLWFSLEASLLFLVLRGKEFPAGEASGFGDRGNEAKLKNFIREPCWHLQDPHLEQNLTCGEELQVLLLFCVCVCVCECESRATLTWVGITSPSIPFSPPILKEQRHSWCIPTHWRKCFTRGNEAVQVPEMSLTYLGWCYEREANSMFF